MSQTRRDPLSSVSQKRAGVQSRKKNKTKQKKLLFMQLSFLMKINGEKFTRLNQHQYPLFHPPKQFLLKLK